MLGSATYEYTVETEEVLDYLLQHMPLVWNRCHTTFLTTPVAFHAQLASYTEGRAYKRAFAWMQNKDTFQTYTGTWNRLLCLLFRVCQTNKDAEVKLVDVWSRLSVDIQQQVKSIWLDALEAYRDKAGLQEPIQERLVQLSASLVMQDLPLWTAVNRNVLLHFAGILSLDIQASEHAGAPTFVPVANSTSHLAALLWVARILVLEYALPGRAYATNGWSSRESYEPQALDRLVQIHQKYLVQHQHTVIGELLDLKAFGRKMRSYDIARFTLRWSKDGQAVGIEKLNAQGHSSNLSSNRLGQHLGQHPLTMQHFRSWVHMSIERAQQQLRTLFGTVQPPTLPALDTLSDSFTARESGLSFLLLPDNYARLEPYAQAFIAAAQAQFIQAPARRSTAARAKLKWKVPACKVLAQQHVRFLQSLLVVLQQTGGQPARGPELTSLKVCNTANSLRNIYIHKGLFCTLVPENKSSAATQQAFWVARYFPECVSTILYYYLVLIRPFVRHLEKQVWGEPPAVEQRYYLWPAKGSPQVERRPGFWPTESMSSALKESCKLVDLPYELTTSSYRQLAIGISKKHLLVPSLHDIATRKPKDQFQTSTELILQRLFAWQAGHDLKEHVLTYGLDADYPTQFSAGLLDLYWAASTAWHEWLGLSSIAVPIQNIKPAAASNSNNTQQGIKRRRALSLDFGTKPRPKRTFDPELGHRHMPRPEPEPRPRPKPKPKLNASSSSSDNEDSQDEFSGMHDKIIREIEQWKAAAEERRLHRARIASQNCDCMDLELDPELRLHWSHSPSCIGARMVLAWR
jgi:hypothetical protein